MKLFAVGDIHGRYDEFIKLLKFSEFNIEEDFLVATGDLIDRGDKSYEVVKWFKEKNYSTGGRIQSVFGNHEHLLISYISGHIPREDYFDKRIRGDKTIESYQNNNVSEEEFISHLTFLGKLPLALEIGDFVFCHGGYDINKPTNKQCISTTLWGDFMGNDMIYKKDLSNFDKTIVFGHEPTYYIYEKMLGIKRYEVWRSKNLLGVDCSFHRHRKMCIVDLYNDIEYYYDFVEKKLYKKIN